MKNTAVKTKEKTGVSGELKFLLKQLLSILCGAALSQCSLFGVCSPFGISFVASLPAGYIAGGAGGAILGYFLKGLSPVRYVCAIFVVAIIRYSLSSYRKLSEKAVFAPLTAMLCCAVTSLTTGISAGAEIEEIAMYLSEALFAGAGAYFMDSMFRIKLHGSVRNLNSRELSCAALFLCLILTGASSFDIYGVAPARVVALFAVLLCAKIGKEAFGSVSGVLAGLIGIMSGADAFLAGAYAAGGLIAGVFADFGQIAIAASFAVSSAVVTVSSDFYGVPFTYIYEILIASVIFAAIPPSVSAKLEGLLRPIHDKVIYTEQSRAVSERLKNASKAVYDAANSVDELSERLISGVPKSAEEISERMYEEVCKGCGLHNFCWEQNYSETADSLELLFNEAAKSGRVTSDNAPRGFLKRCIKSEDYLRLFCAYWGDFSEGECVQKRAENIRNRIYDEFGLAASILGDAANDYSGDDIIDKKMQPRVLSVMNSYGIFPQRILCRINRVGRMKVEVSVSDLRGRIDKFPLTKTLSEACRRSFQLPKVTAHGSKTLLTFSEKPAYRIKTGVYQISGDSSIISGDSNCVYELFDVKKVLMISDGMGSGGNAAVDSAMAVSIISKLTSAGISFSCALEITNAALMTSGEEEALTTVDLAVIDTYSGEVEFMKAGAARSFVRKNYRSVPIESATLPIGILGEVEFVKSKAQVGEDDIVVLMSDGAASGDTQWVLDELNDYEGSDAGELARRLAVLAYDKCSEIHKDDITVLVAYVEANV